MISNVHTIKARSNQKKKYTHPNTYACREARERKWYLGQKH